MAKSKGKNLRHSRIPALISGILIAVIISSYFFIPEVKNFISEAWSTLISDDEKRISFWVKNLGIWGPLFVIIAMSLQMFLLVIPSPLLIVISILAYGPVWGTLLSVTAVTIASSLGFFIGKYVGEAFSSKLIGRKKENLIKKHVNTYGIWAVIITRLTPVLSNDAISFVSGILRMKYWKFILATLAGITPLTLLIAWFGENNDRLKWGLIWVSGGSLILLALYIVYDRRKHMKQKKES